MIESTERGYLHDILEQPLALSKTLQAFERGFDLGPLGVELKAGRFSRFVLTGMGSSFHGLYPLYYSLLAQQRLAWMVETSELLHYAPELVTPDTLVVAVSQSGRSAETVRLMEWAAERGASVLGVTNTPGSPLDVRSRARVLTHAGEEFTVSCKTYLCTLLAHRWLQDALVGRDLEQAAVESAGLAAAVAGYLANWQDHVSWLERELAGVTEVFLAGRGASLAAVGTGGLITKESTHLHAEGLSAASYRHGPIEMAGPDNFVLVFAGDERTRGLNERLVEDVRATGAHAGWVESGAAQAVYSLPAVPESLRPVVEILPVEMMTLALARLKGRVAGEFERATKVTVVE